ncbi:glycosyl transferase [Candidatus Roizmanbacteria bacterium CG10_big_fil_rev_8_21_14_0_10_39_6]|uniref:Glycosyl transferase n=1 Tax=Candidatus Roizmanbacteria bacterium CG10_big_fil_rev_8_21_14_0_10_39_6 TaxID=1974853 RepID=A0A2M8KT19_9BACT|nr:MAG: glycosyl transferase [Candidatus Roizmanbacteria bacterium CG10_big_fil_rev_8_21_14_0_10_39_6]
MSKQRILSIVIPVYNEYKYILDTVTRVAQSDTMSMAKQIVIVDDGSTDGTVNIIRKIPTTFKKKYPSVSIIIVEHKINMGKSMALQTGILKTTGDIVLAQDADLEYDPQGYPVLLEPFLNYDADVVFGSRFISNRPHRVLYFWHYVVNVLLTWFSNMFTNLNLTDMETGYKVFRGTIIRTIAPQLSCSRFGFEPEITGRISKIKNIKIYEVGISYQGRTYEDGKKIGWKDGVYALWAIVKTSLFS